MIETFEELRESWRTQIAAQFGNTLNSGENSNLYKLFFPILDNLFNKYNMLLDFINNKYVYTAEGVWLDRFVGNYNFVRRQPSKAVTTWTTLDSTPFTFVDIGALQVKDALGNVFVNTVSGNTDANGDLILAMQSVLTGSIQNVQAGALTEIVTPVGGINTGSNTSDATGGQDLETDTQLRYRFLSGRAGKGFWNIDGIYRALTELDGVNSVVIIENDQNRTVNGLPAHSIHCIVEGGIDAEIAQTIFEKTDTAIERFGNTMYTVTDIQGRPRDIYFSRPTLTDIEFQVSIIGTGNLPLIQAELKNYIDNSGTSAKLSSFKASNYIESVVDLTQVDEIIINFRRVGEVVWSTYINMTSTEVPNGVLI